MPPTAWSPSLMAKRYGAFRPWGPIAVTPPLQKQGIGSALVRAGLKAMKDAGYALLFLVGSPAYYPRFGYQPALPLGFTSDYVEPDGPHAHFMVALLDERAPRQCPRSCALPPGLCRSRTRRLGR